MRLSIVFTVMNQFPLATVAIQHALDNLSADADAELIVIDNGSDVPFEYMGMKRMFVVTAKNGARVQCEIVRHEKSIGVYPTFWDAMPSGEVIAFFHSDLIVCEEGWDTRVIDAFLHHPKMGLLGFIGSNEIDGAGGRGLGTTSNFQGNAYTEAILVGEGQEPKVWHGSKASIHGKHDTGFSDAAVVDGCAMIFSEDALMEIQQRMDFPPHHFYDKLLSCEVREHGYTMGVLGVACDHISGQTVNQENNYQVMAAEWCDKHGVAKTHNHDDAIYHESERLWLKEYRDEKKLIPCRV